MIVFDQYSLVALLLLFMAVGAAAWFLNTPRPPRDDP